MSEENQSNIQDISYICPTKELTEMGSWWRPVWKLTQLARVRFSVFVSCVYRVHGPEETTDA